VEGLIKSRIVIAVFVVSLVTSLALNLYFYVYVLAQNENATNNMMIRALGSYGAQIDSSEYFLNQYLETHNISLVEHEAAWCAYGAQLAADVCRQASNEEVYYQLWTTAFAVQGFGIYYNGIINDTKLAATTSALDHIWRFFSDFEIVQNENPLEYITKLQGANATATIIYYCHIAQDNLS
jgi:hypothetical protein